MGNLAKEVLSSKPAFLPSHRMYEIRMSERDVPKREAEVHQSKDMMTLMECRVYIPLDRIAVETDDPAAILENFEARYREENSDDDDDRSFH